jgi:small subunit ribosomal protein S4
MQIGPKYKICRRLGSRVFGKCETTKFSISGSATARPKRKKTMSEYGLQLIEKQKVRFTYGLKERQLSNYVKQVQEASGHDNPLSALYGKLEARLDSVVYRLGLANTRTGARQLVSHGHIMINGARVNIPSYQVKVGDVVTIRPQSERSGAFRTLAERLKEYKAPAWLQYDVEKKQGKVLAAPLWGETQQSDLNFGALMEFYSRV